VRESATDSATACPVCEETSTEVYLDEKDSTLGPLAIGPSRQYLSPGRILRCRACGFGFRQMRSSSEQLRNLYRQMDPGVYESELQGRDRTARRHLQIVHRHIRTGRILDVGCASGLFLSQALQAGWEVTGVEPNEKLCEEARKTLQGKGNVQCATLETAHLEGGFDALTLWDVLEHVPDPEAFLHICCDVLRPNGFLFLNLPDLDSREARILGHRWPLLLPEHLNYFNRESLTLCAKRAGLAPVQFGRRCAWFSLKYIAHRVTQHRVPGSDLLRRAAEGRLGAVLMPVSLGETFAVLKVG
jgi:SAM-dependent methyltransferase